MSIYSNNKRGALALLSVLGSIALSGCLGGGSSSGSGSGSGDGNGLNIQASDEEQAVLAAQIGAQEATSAAALAEGSSEMVPTGGGSLSALAVGPMSSGWTDIINCETTYDGSGMMYVDSDAPLDVANKDFPKPPFASDFSATGQTDSVQIRANCEGESYMTLRMDGSMDITSRDDIDQVDNQRASYFRLGGFTGYERSDRPDPGEYLVMEISSGMMDMSMEMRGEGWICEGCVDGKLDTWDGDPEKYVTFSAFMFGNGEEDGEAWRYRMGNGVGEHFQMFLQPSSGSGVVEAELKGRMAYSDDRFEGCGFDVSYSFENGQPLVYENFEHPEATDPKSGRFDLTITSSGATYEVEVQNGEVIRVTDEDGTNLDLSIVDDEEALCPEN